MTRTPIDDPAITRCHELVEKHLPKVEATLWLNPPGCLAAPVRAGWRFWQPHFPQHRELAARGWLELDKGLKWTCAVVYASKHKEENWALLEAANAGLESDGEVLLAVPNDYGARSFEARLKEKGILLGYESARKSRLYRLRAAPSASEPELYLESYTRNADGYWSCPGLFSWKGVDKGSAMLARALEGQRLAGPVGDLGAGWGYLSTTLDPRLPLHLFESDRRGLECAKRNLEGRKVTAHWCDLSDAELWPSGAPSTLATVVSNPPFHSGQREETALGREFARAAWKVLPKGGAYWMVGNTHLAYPRLLAGLFASVEVRAQGEGFTVLRALK